MLLDKAQISDVLASRRVRILIASGDPERIMLVRESLRAWPESVVCRVAVNREDALQQLQNDAPHLVCWDVALGLEPPAQQHGSTVLLLGEDSCSRPQGASAMALPDDYVSGLQQSINREYELRRLLVQLRDAHGNETQSRLLLDRATDGIVVVDPRASIPPSSLPVVSGPRVSEDRLRTVGRLAAGLAHEVNNPLTFVLANLESLRESHQSMRRLIHTLRAQLATDEAITRQSFEEIASDANLQELMDDVADMLTDCYKGIHRIQDIARSLGTFSRADDDRAEQADITRIVDDACAMVFNQIRYRARLIKRFEPIPSIAVFPGRIAQALVNLLTNAAEAIEGGAYDQHRIVVSMRTEGDWVIIAVSDTGIGITQKHRDRIFTPGFTTKAHQGGMGLGLVVSKRVAQEHGGRLEVVHLPERGTRFELHLPIDTGLTVTEQNRESRPVSEAPLERLRLLIVDDDAMVLSALRRRLKRRYDTVTVLGGADALARLDEDPDFDAIVCDLMMPETDGKSFYDRVQRSHPGLADRIVFMSGGAFTPRLRKFAAAVSNPVLQKPVTREDLEATLAAHLDAQQE